MGVGILKSKSGIERMERKWGILLAMPAILGFFIFTLGPIIASFIFSLTNWNIGQSPKYIGLENYRHMFMEDNLFRKSIFATSYYAIVSVPLVMVLAFFIAMLLNQKVKGLSIFRTVFYLPVIVPSIANTIIWVSMFDPDFGLFNLILKRLGFNGLHWIYDEHTAIPSLILMSTWGIGNAAIIFLAGLQGVPNHLYEAVEVDGGNAFHKFLHITLPSMSPTIFFNLIMSLITAAQIFNEAFMMTSGGPDNATLFYVYYIWRTAFGQSDMGYASALAWVLFAVIALITFLVFKTAKNWVYYEGSDHS